jgi:hypothetical protein
VRFDCSTVSEHSLLTIVNSALVTASSLSFSVSRNTTASAPLRGTYQLGFEGSNGTEWTTTMNYNLDATNIKYRLEALPSIEEVIVTTSGSYDDGFYINVEFTRPYVSISLPNF